MQNLTAFFQLNFSNNINFCASKSRPNAKPQNVSGKCNRTPFQMTETYIQDKTFDRNDTLTKGEYENCIFNNCNFADNDLSEFKFTDCAFNGCNLSLAKLNKTAFRDIKFKDCKMLGLRFDTCNEFGLSFSFDGCQLNHSSFFKTKIKKTVLWHLKTLPKGRIYQKNIWSRLCLY